MLFFLITVLGVSAQEVVSTQGDTYENTKGNISFTVGEVVINTVGNGTNDLTQGFHQSKWDVVGIEDHTPAFEVLIYPNPTKDILNISAADYQDVVYHLYDGSGKVVLQNALQSNLTSVQVREVAAGNYTLVLSNATARLKTFRLIKVK